MKWRNSKERELLANGGSREQTLPNKNNPNPDLSDAEGDRPKLDLSDLSPLASPDHSATVIAVAKNGTLTGYDGILSDDRLDDDTAGEEDNEDEEISVT
ncbi:hypothetical protein PR048_012800 [Dryococelus australis]|uniref:Uncharacterized protein n=1 Tax=Dryococelus australis TaxID=614101 RepID=A0ABQ9HQD2_9NEOP|nr:hypothetical protein PR048_012800 [Dryococelus australis]